MPTDPPRSKPKSPSERPDAKPARILVADDDEDSRKLLGGILRQAGHLVELAENGQEAIERVAAGGIDLVLLDAVMPRVSGIEACRRLKTMTAETFLPVLLVTVKTDGQSRVEGLKIGADDYVCKPFEEHELAARVGAMLRIKTLYDHVAREKERLERLSIHDELTGAYNYRYLHKKLTEEFRRAERYHDPFALVLIDIDQLKSFNDTGGRALGDGLIVHVANAIKRSIRDVDVLARYGGEEFLVILPSTHFAGSVAAAERMLREASQHAMDFDSRRHRVRVSIGVSLYPSRDVKTKDALLRAADAAVEQAKREGGNRVCIYQQQGSIYSPALGAGASRPASEPASANVSGDGSGGGGGRALRPESSGRKPS